MNQLSQQELTERSNKLYELSGKKHALEMQSNIVDPKRFTQDWYDLAQEYAVIDARANYFACMKRYRDLGGEEKFEQPVERGVELLENVFEQEPFVPEPDFVEVDQHEFDWQSRADIGD